MPPSDILQAFSPATADWFRASFTTPTPAQEGAWRAIGSGRHTLVVAPTGSGKTLAAFLHGLDRIAAEGPAEPARRCRVLYVSPMKALAVDVERNLRSPLVGIGHAAARLGLPAPDVTVAVRSGDTPASERRAFARTPSDILITTPESLFLLLTSAARDSLRGVETVIVDEIHALAGTKRGAHLALSLERLDALLERPAQRIGLSATVRPVEEVSRYLAGGRPVEVVAPSSEKRWDLSVVVPVPDLTDLPTVGPDDPATGAPAGPGPSIWPHVEERIVDLISAHRSTLVFANSRRLAERLTARLNEIWDERGAVPDGGEAGGAAYRDEGVTHHMGTMNRSAGRPAILARAHHGSVSKEARQEIEEDLKAGRLPAVVATSSLELGIDMGAVDLVVQVEAPPSVASGLQRVGRAGHQVGAVSRGVLFPKFRADLLSTAVVVERMRNGEIEALSVPANPLDVLAQQIVAMVALDDWTGEDALALARRTASFSALSRAVLDSVLDMLSGRFPSEEFAELRARLVWDRTTDTLSGRRGSQRLAVTSGGTIPDRGLYAVFLAGAEGPGRRVGELDEEMVYESRVGDLFTLGTSTWRIEEITHDRVLVTPAPGQPGRLPFWRGDSPGRPAELGRALGAFVRELGGLDDGAAQARVSGAGLDPWASDNLLAYLADQREATGHLPDDRTIVVERFRDELGDWRVALHSPFGAPVHAPWALAIAARMRERFGVEVQALHADDGIVLRLPDLEAGDDLAATVLDLVTIDPDEITGLVTDELGGSALFAARFRECASRALLLPRRNPTRRQPLWQQRQRASQLLQVAARYPSFPIVLETVRECVQDVFDVPALADVLQGLATRTLRLVDVETASPSPFARTLLFGYVAQYLYEGDSPLAERRAAALSLDPALLSELLGGAGLALRDLLDAEAIARTEAELQRLTPDRACRDAEDVIDLLRALGPLTPDEVVARSADTVAAPGWIAAGIASREVIEVRVGGADMVAASTDAARLRDALGTSLPLGVADALLAGEADPLGSLLGRWARTHGPFHPAAVAERFGLGTAVVAQVLARLERDGRIVEGEFLPQEAAGPEFCDAEVLRILRRRSLAALRAEVEPVTTADFARFLPAWQGVGTPGRGREALLRAVEQLSGAIVPASALESFLLPARVRDYSPALLDEVMAAGDVLWQGHGPLPGDDGWISLHLVDTAADTLAPPTEAPEPDSVAGGLLAALRGGAWFFRPLSDEVGSTDDAALTAALWELVWQGRVTGDTFAPVRALLRGGRTAHRTALRSPRSARYAGRRTGLGTALGRPGRAVLPARSGPPTTTGRWSLLPAADFDPTVRAVATAEVLLDRYGVLTRGILTSLDLPGGFGAVLKVLARAEEAGKVRRGYFVESLGASQFGATAAVDRLRDAARRATQGEEPGAPLVLAAADPANPYGAALPWPARETSAEAGRTGHVPGRKPGALVVLDDGSLVVFVERGGRSLLTFTDETERLERAARTLAETVHRGQIGALSVERVDGTPVLGGEHPMTEALLQAGFHTTPRGVRLRR